VRLPKQFRFETDQVRSRRRGTSVILEPIALDWACLEAVVGLLDADFAQDATDRP
jgi:antitoxin VapB